MPHRTFQQAAAVRDAELAEMADYASELLVGREVIAVTAYPHMPMCDATNVVRLDLSDGTAVTLTGGYSGYSGHSCDEYVETITVAEVQP